MLCSVLEDKHITTYALSGKTGIPYSTLSDIVCGKTDIKNVSASVLYKLSRALGMTMEQLYLSEESGERIYYLENKQRTVYIHADGRVFSYLGPVNLVGFRNISKVQSDVLYVDTYFLDEDERIYVEEDYIDLKDVFEGYESLLSGSYKVVTGAPGESRTRYLIDNSLLVSDGMAIAQGDNGTDDIVLEITNIKRNKDRLLLRLKDYTVLFSNMSKQMEKRSLDAVKRNQVIIYEELEERKRA